MLNKNNTLIERAKYQSSIETILVAIKGSNLRSNTLIEARQIMEIQAVEMV